MKRFHPVFAFAILLTLAALILATAPIPGQIQTPIPAAPALNPPTFENDVYAISPYGAATRLNPNYYATDVTANALAQLFGAVPVLSPTSPETGPVLQRWVTVEVPSSLIPTVMNGQVATLVALQDLLALPPVKIWVLKFPSGCIDNAGYIAGFYLRNPPAQFPNLANRFALINLQADCPSDNITIHQ